MASCVYLAFFRREAGGGYSVTFPDVPAAISEGDDFDDARANAQEALEIVLDALIEEGSALPVPRRPEALLSEAHGAIVVAIEGELSSKTVRVNVSFDERLLARIDQAAEQSGRTRSGFLARAAREWITGRRVKSDQSKLFQQTALVESAKSAELALGKWCALSETVKVELAASANAVSAGVRSLGGLVNVGRLYSMRLHGSSDEQSADLFESDGAFAVEGSYYVCRHANEDDEPVAASNTALPPTLTRVVG